MFHLNKLLLIYGFSLFRILNAYSRAAWVGVHNQLEVNLVRICQFLLEVTYTHFKKCDAKMVEIKPDHY